MAVVHALTDLGRQYRGALIGALPVGGAGLAIAWVLGHPLAGGLLWVGLALGFVNSWLMVSSALRHLSPQDPRRGRYVVGTLPRLAGVTIVAVGLTALFWPEGFAVLIGLAVCQVFVLAKAYRDALREVRSR